MIKLFRKLTLILVASVIPAFLLAQSRDAGAIGTIGLSTDIGESLSASLGQELRFNQNLTTFNRSCTSLGLDYILIRKLLKAEIDYDLIYQHQNDYYEFRHRASLGLAAQKKLSSVSFKLRTKMQSTWRDESRGDYKFNPKFVWRNKLECVYSIFGSSIKPFASGEVFCPLNSVSGFYMDGFRAVLGAKCRTTPHITLEFLIRYDQDIQQVDPKGTVYGGIGWYYNL